MFQAVDTAMTYAAEFVLFGSLIYFPIAFIVGCWQIETQKADDARLAMLQARCHERKQALAQVQAELVRLDRELSLDNPDSLSSQLQETQEKLAQVESDLALMAKVMPLLQQEKTNLEAQLASASMENPGDDDAIAQSGVPSLEASTSFESSVDLATVEEIVCDEGRDDAGVEASPEVPANVPLPIVARKSLTLWKRRDEQVVKTECLSIPIPTGIQRFRWRKTEVIRLSDLETIAVIV